MLVLFFFEKNMFFNVSFSFLFFQKCDTYTLIMEVRDMGGQHFGLFNTGTITISLEDENDNAPYFTETSVRIPLYSLI